jgi:hypothetical protein
MTTPNPCAAINCFLQRHAIEMCRRERCCYRWMREAREARIILKRQGRQPEERGLQAHGLAASGCSARTSGADLIRYQETSEPEIQGGRGLAASSLPAIASLLPGGH